MTSIRAIALGGLGLALAWAGPASAGSGPRIVSARPDGAAELNRALELRVTAAPRGDQVQGLRLSFPDLGGVFAESACRLGPASAGTGRTRRAAFAVPYRPAFSGLHLLELAVTAGRCGEPAGTSRRSVALEVAQEAEPPVIAVAPVVSPCRGADHLPLRPRLRSLRLTLVCLINAERRAAGLAPLRSSRRLRRAALVHAHDMRARRYVGHAAPGGPELRGRLRRAGIDAAVAGENLGVAPGRLGTPRSIVSAWMAAGPLRRNVLDPAFTRVGVAALSTVPGAVRRSGGTYVADFAG